MDVQRGLLLNWTYLHQQKCMDELRQSSLLRMELEDTRIRAQNELNLRDVEIAQLKEMLRSAIDERNEARESHQKLLMEKKLIQRQLQHSWVSIQRQLQHSGVSSVEDDSGKGKDSGKVEFSFSDGDESTVSSPAPAGASFEEEAELPVEYLKGLLPAKGKFLEAVVRAGPLLQTLLLSGSLPQWRHPPPPLDAYQLIPPPPPFSGGH